jgi:hypothetical protein
MLRLEETNQEPMRQKHRMSINPRLYMHQKSCQKSTCSHGECAYHMRVDGSGHSECATKAEDTKDSS